MPKTMWKTGGFFGKFIEPIEAVKETDKQVVYLRPNPCMPGTVTEQRSPKRGQHDNFFNSWDEAKAFLVENAGSEVKRCEENLQRAQAKLQQMEELSQPLA